MPVRVCRDPACPHLIKEGRYCPEHARNQQQSRNNRRRSQRKVYLSAKWQATRRRQLFDHPLCAHCGAIATDVHHLQDLADGGDPWQPANLQSLCRWCHGHITGGRSAGRPQNDGGPELELEKDPNPESPR
jgi:5-methylcytosine-specific restriction protein A